MNDDYDSNEYSREKSRGNALASAILMRDCSLRREISFATRHACRTQMRVQAMNWRHPRGGSPAPAVP